MHSIKEILRSPKMRRSMPDGMRFLMHRIEKPDDERQTDLQQSNTTIIGGRADVADGANDGTPARTSKVTFEKTSSRAKRQKIK